MQTGLEVTDATRPLTAERETPEKLDIGVVDAARPEIRELDSDSLLVCVDLYKGGRLTRCRDLKPHANSQQQMKSEHRSKRREAKELQTGDRCKGSD